MGWLLPLLSLDVEAPGAGGKYQTVYVYLCTRCCSAFGGHTECSSPREVIRCFAQEIIATTPAKSPCPSIEVRWARYAPR